MYALSYIMRDLNGIEIYGCQIDWVVSVLPQAQNTGVENIIEWMTHWQHDFYSNYIKLGEIKKKEKNIGYTHTV